MIKLLNIVYHYHNECNTPEMVIAKHQPSFGFTNHTTENLAIAFVKHLRYKGVQIIKGKTYGFFTSRNSFWYIPFASHRFIKKQRPDIVMIEGLSHPIQLLALKLLLPGTTKFIVQHHGEIPLQGIKQLFQRFADHYTSAYLFTAAANADRWVKNVIQKPPKCVEVLEASSDFRRKGLEASQLITGLTGTYNYLWVGRLIPGKDPFTVLAGFEQYLLNQPSAKLYMIYQDDSLLDLITAYVNKSTLLTAAVKFVGRVDHGDLATWYSAANFYISGSHAEGSGYALLEAMACGCIPVVTAIPSFIKITSQGKYGFLYPPADVSALKEVLKGLNKIDVPACRKKTTDWFQKKLSFASIAGDIESLCNNLVPVQS